MTSRTVAGALLAVALLSPQATAAEPITFATLLQDMLDRTKLAEYPEPGYACKQASSYDRRAKKPGTPEWFSNADFSNFLGCEETDGRKEWIMMAVDGPGVIVRWWATQHQYKGTIRVYLDGAKEPVFKGRTDHLLAGTGTHALTGPPLSARRGAGCNLYLPIPFGKGCKITYDGPNDPKVKRFVDCFFYAINYRHYPGGTGIKTFSPSDLKTHAALVSRVQKALLRPGGNALPIKRTVKGLTRILKPGAAMTREIKNAGAICRLRLRITAEDIKQAMRSTVLQAEFDGKQRIWAPVGEFFGSGVGLNPYKDWWFQVEKDGWMTCWWPMPFKKRAVFRICNYGTTNAVTVELDDIGVAGWKWTDKTMYFHSAWRGKNNIITPGDKQAKMKDWNYISIKGKGVYVGDSLSLYNRPKMNWRIGPWWGEGDEKIFVDDEAFPSHFGTGSEDYFGYAWNYTGFFDGPFHAQPVGKANWGIDHTTNNRVRILDPIPFRKRFRFYMGLWHWQPNVSLDYATTTHWYAFDGAKSNGHTMPERVREKVGRSASRR